MTQAREVKALGADIIVAQGTEAGGHGGDLPLYQLLSDVLAIAEDTPVLAAGGLVEAHDVSRVMALGAHGALLGTRFYASHESEAPVAQKQRIVAACEGETVRTRVFDYARGYDWPAPYTGRALKNAFHEKWCDHQDMHHSITAAEKAAYAEAAAQNNFSVAGLFVSEAVGRITEILSVAQVMSALSAVCKTN